MQLSSLRTDGQDVRSLNTGALQWGPEAMRAPGAAANAAPPPQRRQRAGSAPGRVQGPIPADGQPSYGNRGMLFGDWPSPTSPPIPGLCVGKYLGGS